MKKKLKKEIKFVYYMITFFIFLVSATLGLSYFDEEFKEYFEESFVNEFDIEGSNALVDIEGELKIHFIDVGQADCIYISQGEHSMLIDGGNNEDGELVVNYLKKQGVSSLDYIVATHPHEDHIGGLDYVINEFDVNKVIMPNITSTTKTFEDLLVAIKNRQENKRYSGFNGSLKEIPQINSTYELGNATFIIYGPNSQEYEELNNYSIVLQLKYGNNTFLFTGDAQIQSEKEMISKGYNLKSDLLKIGHHGSHTSTSEEFLNAVCPKYAVICVGKDNTYNLPKSSVMNRLKNSGIIVYRTDESGCIIVTSDGNNITFDKNPGSYSYMK